MPSHKIHQAIHLLTEFQEKINWKYLCFNPAAGELLKANPELIDWSMISSNPCIFEYDYAQMTRPFTEELMSVVYHPDNFKRLL